MAKEYACHLFVCTQQKENGACCANRGSVELRLRLKKKMDELHPEWRGNFRLNSSGCLGQCEEGIAMVGYPEGKWIHEVQDMSEDQIVRHIEELYLRANQNVKGPIP